LGTGATGFGMGFKVLYPELEWKVYEATWNIKTILNFIKKYRILKPAKTWWVCTSVVYI